MPTLVTPRITPVSQKNFPFVPTIHKWFANALLLPMQVTGASHCSSSCTMNTKQIRIVQHTLTIQMENSHPTGAAPTQSPHELALTPETLKELWRAGQQ
jgi:hypothetical protein